MSATISHHQWLHTKFPISSKEKKASVDALTPAGLQNLRGRRLWSKFNSATVPANVGGTIAFHDQDNDMIVRWDNGTVSMHTKDGLLRLAFLIGGHQSLKDHIDCLSNRCKCGRKI
ncbi:MAG: hypothetical protein WCT03_06850 [Candidatus Obscuribacterales bacterium]